MTKIQTGRRVFTQLARPILALITDFVYPPFCLLCDSRLQPTEQFVCSSCWKSLPQFATPFVKAQDLVLSQHAYFNSSFAMYEYSEGLQKLIHIMKYSGMSHLAEKMGKELAHVFCAQKAAIPIDIVTPVPLHPSRFRERGYNQAEILARKIASLSDLDIVHTLRRVRYTNQQAKYNRDQRIENVKDAFELVKGLDLRGKNIAIVDDVQTTGSTMNECAKQLRNVGAQEILALTITRI